MPKLKKFNDKQFVFPIGGKKIIFANNTEQKTYIKNRVDRLLSKEPETIKWLNGFEKNSVFFDKAGLEIIINKTITSNAKELAEII